MQNVPKKGATSSTSTFSRCANGWAGGGGEQPGSVWAADPVAAGAPAERCQLGGAVAMPDRRALPQRRSSSGQDCSALVGWTLGTWPWGLRGRPRLTGPGLPLEGALEDAGHGLAPAAPSPRSDQRRTAQGAGGSRHWTCSARGGRGRQWRTTSSWPPASLSCCSSWAALGRGRRSERASATLGGQPPSALLSRSAGPFPSSQSSLYVLELIQCTAWELDCGTQGNARRSGERIKANVLFRINRFVGVNENAAVQPLPHPGSSPRVEETSIAGQKAGCLPATPGFWR